MLEYGFDIKKIAEEKALKSIKEADSIFKNSLFNNFNIKPIGEKLTEDYHHPELEFQTYHQKLFKVEPKR